jgi:Mrp family chromosome partitioning ATPase
MNDFPANGQQHYPPPLTSGALPHPMHALPGAVQSDFGAPQQQVNILKLVHGLFRGRYMLTAVLAGIFMLAGAVYAVFTNKPLYQSKGIILVTPVNYDPMKSTPEAMLFAADFVRTQATLIQSDRVVSKAKATKAWQDLNIPDTPKEERAFRDALSVVPSRDQIELIRVSFAHEDPMVAFTALTQVCEAYNQLFVEFEDRDRQATRERILRDEKRVLEANIQQNSDQITQLASELGTTNPEAFMDFGNNKLMEVDARILDLELRLIAAGGSANMPAKPQDDPSEDEQAAKPRDEMSYEEIAGTDATMSQLLLMYHDVLSRKAILNDQGLGQNHIEMRKASNEERRLEKQIEDQRKAFVEGRATAPQPGVGPGAGQNMVPRGPGMETVGSLEIQLQKLRAHKQQIVAENRSLARKKRELEDKRAQVEGDRINLADVNKAIDQLRREREMMSSVARVKLLLDPKPESFPTVDKRFRNAVLYGGLGTLIPILGIALYALANRTFRYSDEAIDEGPASTPLLGILPRLPADLNDAEQAVAAAHCVHQIRTLVQISAGPRNKVIAITSSNPGDGKTSMALALGYSFAGSGSRVLLVDLDLVGQGLSRGIKMREQSSLFRAVTEGDPRARVRASGMDNLWVLAAGIEDDHRTANRLSGLVVNKLIQTLREDYDIVLIDTGPVLGSIEAHLVCAEADSVILVVGAGRARGQVKSAVAALRRVHARLLGMVFNLAHQRDFRMSAASQSFRSVRPDGPPPQRPKPDEFPDLEPLPRVVAIDTRR